MSLLSVAELVLQFAVKYLAPAEMKVAAVCLSVYPPAQVTFVTVSFLQQPTFPPVSYTVSKMTIDSMEGTAIGMPLFMELHNTDLKLSGEKVVGECKDCITRAF